MRLLYVDRGTPLLLAFGEDSGQARDVWVSYIDNEDDLTFYVSSGDIFNEISSFRGRKAIATIDFRNDLYQFACEIRGRYEGKKLRAADEAVTIRAKSDFAYIPRRSADRIEMLLRARVYVYANGGRGDFVAEMQASDISRDGIKLLSDKKLEAPKGTMFVTEFSLVAGSLFSLPARLMWSRENTDGSVYGYGCGFVFDLDERPEQRERLLLDIYKARSRGV